MPGLAPMLGLTTEALYERQRALTRLGVLPVEKGRGPGSGVQATPQAVAALFIAALATDNLSEVDDRVTDLISAPATRERCPLTKAPNFGVAIATLLTSKPARDRLIRVRAHREMTTATIEFRAGKQAKSSVFGHLYVIGTPCLLFTEAYLHGDAIRIAADALSTTEET